MRASIYNTESSPTSPRTEEGRTIVAASTTNIHAAVQESAANLFPGPITQPDVPRKIAFAFAAGWQGGDITIVGLDANGRYLREVVADNPGSTVNTTNVFSFIASMTKETIAGTTDTVTVGGAAATYYSSIMDTIGQSGLGVEVQTTGTLTGTWTLWFANRDNPDLEDDDHWVQETTFSPTNPAGAATHWGFHLSNGHSRYWRLKYAPTSGSGALLAWATSELL